jgi:hypothetical protein
MELFFQKKLTPASFGFFFFYGFGGFLNAIGVFISFWQIRGSFFSLGNAVIFMSFLCYSFGLLQFEIFFLTVDSQISSTFQVYQYFAIAAIAIEFACYFTGKHWTKQIEDINRLQELMEGDEEIFTG